MVWLAAVSYHGPDGSKEKERVIRQKIKRGAITCLAVRKDADIVAVERRCDQLSDIAEDLLLCALWPKYSVKLKSLRGTERP